MNTVLRRCVTVPVYLGLAAALPLLFAALPLVALVDALRGANWATTRALLFFAVYIACEAVGIVAATLLWIVYRVLPGLGADRYERLNFRLQCWWAKCLFRSAAWIFGFVTTVDGEEEVARGPFLVFARHASTADTVLPAVFISARRDILLRYVLKKELLWDPCLDIVGNRLRNHFVDRTSQDRAHEVEEVAHLADDLNEHEGVLIYPEGTRFSPAKLERALMKLAETADADLLECARRLRHVLPPKLGGPIALLQRNRETDLVLLGHCGFEGIESLADLLNGALIGRAVNVRFWRIRRSDIPIDPTALRHWLLDMWRQIDEWIDETRAHTPLSARGRS